MDDRLVTLATYWTLPEATIARDALIAGGIRATLADEESVAMAWHLSNAFGGIKLLILERDSDVALAILDAANPSTDDPDATDADDNADEPLPEDFLPDPPPDTTAAVETNRDRLAHRAFLGAVLGLIFLPLHFYVFILLIRVYYSDEPLSNKSRGKALFALAMNAFVLCWMYVLAKGFDLI